MDSQIHTDPVSGRQWRQRFPAGKALCAVTLFAGGLIMSVTGLAISSLAVGVTGVLCLLPGAWASFQLARVWRGGDSVTAARWLVIEEVDPDVEAGRR